MAEERDGAEGQSDSRTVEQSGRTRQVKYTKIGKDVRRLLVQGRSP